MRIGNRILRTLGVIAAISMLAAACSTTPPPSTKKSSQKSAQKPSKKPSPKPPQARDGGYYKDDGPGTSPKDLTKVPDAAPQTEPLLARKNRPYKVQGKTYTPRTRIESFSQRGVASWYGRRFHGRATASGERYDMHAMTAAHPTLPIPSYARVTSLENGRSVVVRINDRGPFLHGRIIDLSYAAASKLDFIKRGSARVEVEQIVPGSKTSTPEPMPNGDFSEPMQAYRAETQVTTHTLPNVEHMPEAVPVTSREITQNSNDGTISGGQRLFLQLGVFTSRENADSFYSRILAQTSDLALKTEILSENGYFRIYAGPYTSPTDARTIAERIEDRTGIQPFIVRRD